MIEIPEAATLARQARENLTGRTVTAVRTNASPHRFAFFTADPADHGRLLGGRPVTGAAAHGGLVDLDLDGRHLVLGDGARPRHVPAAVADRAKHQLRLDLDDGTALVVSVQMYGGMAVSDGPDGQPDNPYDRAARTAPSPLGDGFDDAHVDALLAAGEHLALKAVLATGQRVPGLGNGVLQDVLWTARLHPRRRVSTLDAGERATLAAAVRDVLRAMTAAGGRDTEPDLRGDPGGYRTVMCRAALDRGCPRCGGAVARSTFLGGAVYVCPACQPGP